MDPMTKCACCQVELDDADLINAESFLDFNLFKRCGTCADNLAEPEAVVIAALQRKGEISDEVYNGVRVYLDREYLTIEAWEARQVVPQPRPEPESPDFLSSDDMQTLRWLLDRSLDIRRDADHRAAEKPKPQSGLGNIVRRLRKIRFHKILRRANGSTINRSVSNETRSAA